MAKKFAIRVAIADVAGLSLSAIWHIFSDKEDIYIAANDIEIAFKTSLHSSGKYRHAFVSQEHSDLYRKPGLDRAVHKWIRPTPQSHRGRLLFQILIPGAGLPTLGLEGCTKKFMYLDIPDKSEILYLSLVELHTHSGGENIAFGMHKTKTISAWKTPGGVRLYLVTHIEKANSADMDNWKKFALENSTIQQCVNSMSGPDMSKQIRATLTMDTSDGIGRLVDVDMNALREWAMAST